MAIASYLTIISFQNCGQPGAITINATEEKSEGAQETPPAPPHVSYKDYEKTLTINQSRNKVDVLVVIDNSGSMSFEQSSMANRFSSFIEKLRDLDWQLGIVTTDMRIDPVNPNLKDGRLIYFERLNSYLIKSTDHIGTAQLAFAETIQRPAGEGSGNEQGIAATYRALERTLALDATNLGLIRQGAALTVILVSDSDETVVSNKPGDVSTFGRKNIPENLLEFVKTTFPEKSFKFNSIVVRDGDQACLNLSGSSNEAYGRNYQKLTHLSSGILGSVCDSDYGSQLSIIGESTTEQVRVVTLDCTPADFNSDGAVDLTMRNSTGNIITSYLLNGRLITFDAVLPVDKYKINYRCPVLNGESTSREIQ